MNKQATQPLPSSGGSYVRMPDGRLLIQSEIAAERAAEKEKSKAQAEKPAKTKKDTDQ